MGTWDDSGITEASGLALSKKWKDIAYVHNDEDGDIFIVNLSTGETVGKIGIKGHTLVDPEDIDIDANGYLRIADIGDNSAARTSVFIYKIKEPGPGYHGDKTWTQYELRYPSGTAHNAEAFTVWPNDKKQIVTKEASSTVYELPKTLKTDAVNNLKQVATGLPSYMAGIVASPDGRLAFGVRKDHNSTIYVFNNQWETKDPISMTAMVKPEGIGLSADGKTLWVCDDKGSAGGHYQKVKVPTEYQPYAKPYVPPTAPLNPCGA
jgi:DNA-binding beta-propeller fold protein YncE